jgi:Fe-S-cluster-containing dehydrogenase component/formate-dependent nitrite reductase membrane component NrfD
MMKFGFLIDHRKCIGCHACSVACKEEHQVPLGVYRTWVKYVERGEFPYTQRHFTVLRCNHCERAPCVTICPVTALYKRPDGIVDFDPNVCIGCKACMQACPYDALYIDPSSNTAAKCNFCAHRVENGLQPSCEIVCPTQAIISGDLDDPSSTISRLTTREPVRARKPEKGTVPQLFYIDADESSLTPTAASQPQDFGMWSQVNQPHITDTSFPLPGMDRLLPGAATSFSLQDLVPQKPHTVYDVAHAVPWGRKVSMYIWTKSIAAGAFLLSALGVGLGLAPDNPLFTWAAPILALLFLGLTTFLLVVDLKRPERFYTILLRPQWRSWLTIGAYILLLYGVSVGLSFLAAVFGAGGLRHVLLWPGGLLAILAAIYTGFLFGQAKGRDLWLSPALPVHLLVQALVAGAAVLAIVGIAVPSDTATKGLLHDMLLWSLLANLFIMLVGELWMPHGTQDAATAARLITRGSFKQLFWGVVIGLGHAVPVLLLVLVPGSPMVISLLAGALALVGLLAFEHVWLLAGQSVPLS